ncbi:AgmX/PglI C-terminal domain-containing protein [candidate division KSB1 bacterium]|nr:AgmX/PglI C-terminal domain-containing protein [candidate division KSB1 bacterium]
MKDFSHDVDSSTAVEPQYTVGRSSSGYVRNRPLDQFKIEKFPREFRKDILGSLDYRFLIILIVTFVVELAIILFLEHYVPQEIDATTISNIQQQYVDLLLEDKLEPTTGSSTLQEITGNASGESIDHQTLTGLSEWMDIFADRALESFEDTPVFSPTVQAPPQQKTQETLVPTREQVSTARANATVERARSREDLEQEVSNIGLLGMLSGKSANYDYEYIDDLLDYAELNADHFANVLSKLNSIQVPRHNTAGYIISQRRRNELGGGELKRGRVNADGAIAAAVEDIDPLAEAKTTTVARQMKYEDVPSSTNALEKLQPQPGSGVRREAKDVMRVVQSHKRALQDCYKQTLKRNPAIRGKIVIRFTVSPMGEVVDAAVVNSTLNDAEMEECLTYRISRWRDFGYCDPAFGDITYKQVFNFGK